VDVSHPGEEPDYVSHIFRGHEAGQSSQPIVFAGSGLADGDEQGRKCRG
jgi:hypothetical protein